MSALTESAARRHLERHMRQQGHARGHAKRVAKLLTIAEVRRLLPIWRRLAAAAGRMPSDDMRDREPWRTKAPMPPAKSQTATPDTTQAIRAQRASSEGKRGAHPPCRHQNTGPIRSDTASTRARDKQH